MTEATAPAVERPAVGATDVQRILYLFAHGLSGRALHVKPHDAHTALGRESVIGTDGATVIVPEVIALFDSARHNFGAYLVSVLHQLGQIEEGTFDFSVDHEFHLWSDRWIYRRVFQLLEDRRIDMAIRRRYPGASADLDRVLAVARSARSTLITVAPREVLVSVLTEWSLGAPDHALVRSDATGLLPRLLRLAAAVDAEAATVDDSGRIATAICALFDELTSDGALRVPGDIDPGDVLPELETSTPDESGGGLEDQGDVEALPADELSGPGVELRGQLTATSLAERLLQGQAGTIPDEVVWALDANESVPAPEPDPADRPLPAAHLPPPRQPAFLEGERSFLYDEWDYHEHGYLTGWCRVYEHRLRGDDHEFIAGVRRRHADLASRVRRTFSSVRPESWHRVHTTNDGDELDLDAVITAMVDRRAGHVTDEHLYIRRERARREVAAAFLLDISGSTSSPIPDPDAVPEPPKSLEEEEDEIFHNFGPYSAEVPPGPPERRVLDVAKDAIALMCDALQILGDDHAIYGFSGEGRDSVEFYVAKEFRDAPSAKAFAGLAAMEPRRYTRMGPAIRHAVTKLAKQPARTKVLIVVSDGYPQDKDYGPTRGDNEYGLHDTARALQEAERARIATFCVTVDPAGHDYLRRMCAEDRYLVIDDVTTLPRELTKIYRALTGVRSRSPGA